MAENLEIKIKTAIDAVGTAQTLGELKKSIKDLKGLALQTEQGSEAFNTLTNAIGQANDKLGDLNEAIKTQTGNSVQTLISGFQGIGSIALNSMQVAQGAMQAFGSGTNDAMEEMRKLQAIMALTSGLKNLADIGDTISNIGNSLKSTLLPLYTQANQAILNMGTYLKNISWSSISEGMTNFFSMVSSGFGNLITKAGNFFTALKAFVSANPLGLILLAITTIIGLLSVMIDDFKPVQMLFNGIKAVIGGIIDALKSLGDALGITSFAAKKANAEQMKLLGEQKKEIENRYDLEIGLARAAGKNTSLLEKQKTLELKKNIDDQIKSLLDLQEMKGNLNEEELKKLEDFRDQSIKFATQIIVAEKQAATDWQNMKDENRQRQIDAMKDDGKKRGAQLQVQLDSETKRYEKQLEDIWDLYKNNRELMPSELTKMYEEAEKAHNATMNKIRSDARKTDIEAHKTYLSNKQAITKQNNELEIAELILKNKKEENIRKQKELAATATLEMELRENSDKVAARQKFFETMDALAKEEIANEQKVYETKLKFAQATAKQYEKSGGPEYKKALQEQAQLTFDFEEKKQKILEASIDKQDKALTDALQKYIRQEGDTLDKLYRMEIASADERALLARRRIAVEYKDETARKVALANLEKGLEKEKELINDKYKGELTKLGEEILTIEQDDIEQRIMLADELAHKKENAAKAARDLEVAMGKDVEKADEKYAKRREEIWKDFEKTKNKIIEEGEKEAFQKRMQTIAGEVGKYAAVLTDIVNLISQFQQQSIDQEMNKYRLAYETKTSLQRAAYDQETQNMEDNFAIQMANFKGTEEEKNAIQKAYAQEKVRRDNAQKTLEYKQALDKYNFEEELRKKQFQQQKAIAIANATIQGVMAVLQALGSFPPPYSFIMAGVVGAVAAAQIAMIAQQQYTASGAPPTPPTLANPEAAGLGGGGGGGGGGGMQTGGPTAPAFFGIGQGNTMMPKKEEGPVKVYVLENDISDVQRRVNVVESRATTKI